MGKIINLEIFGHPLNILTIMLMIVFFWLGAFVFHARLDRDDAPQNPLT
jgi:hypothetical protein